MALYREDMRAGYLGMIIGGIVLGLVLYGIVHLTNMKYAGKEHGENAPAASTH